ncbi:MAG: NUDIX domain-containing protein [Armatimonadetes bacterium]|nr:NUDIX domain-containing protein [Armatimonadota bacterium]
MAESQEDESLLCVGADVLHTITPSAGLFVGEDLHERILDALVVKRRCEVEGNPRWKQLVVYAVVRVGSRFLEYKRPLDRGDPRLRGKYSLGVGGHANVDDTVANVDCRQMLEAAVCREFEEETGIQLGAHHSGRFLAYVQDEAEPVDKDHLGSIWLVDLEGLRPSSVASAEITEPRLLTLEELRCDLARMETWSRLLVEYLGGRPIS